MGVEIERKFLIDDILWGQLQKPEATEFKQGYLVNEAGKTIRVRVAGRKAYLTIKGITEGFSRKEFEYEIPVKDATELLADFAGSLIEKKRFCIDFGGNIWEVDVFEGDNAGLIVAEIELNSETDAFELPGWIAAEVTGDERYYNSKLSTHPFKNWD